MVETLGVVVKWSSGDPRGGEDDETTSVGRSDLVSLPLRATADYSTISVREETTEDKFQLRRSWKKSTETYVVVLSRSFVVLHHGHTTVRAPHLRCCFHTRSLIYHLQTHLRRVGRSSDEEDVSPLRLSGGTEEDSVC
jgi:hypothetical protein